MKSKKKHAASAPKLTSRNLLKKNKFSLTMLVVFALAFASVGSYQVWRSFAAEDDATSVDRHRENELRSKADFNQDGQVNGSDASFLLKSVGTQPSKADLDGNGQVDLIDINLFMDVYRK